MNQPSDKEACGNQPNAMPNAILVNGEDRPLTPGTTVETLLQILGVTEQRIAVELNRSILPRTDYQRILQVGDQLEVVTFVGGG